MAQKEKDRQSKGVLTLVEDDRELRELLRDRDKLLELAHAEQEKLAENPRAERRQLIPPRHTGRTTLCVRYF